MNIRSFIHAALILSSLPLIGCSGDDDDATNTQASPLAGHTYVLTTENRSWVEPKGIAKDVEAVMPHFLFQVTATGGNNVSIRMSVAPKIKDSTGMMVLPDVNQDMCNPTIEIASSGIAPQIGPMDVDLHLINALNTPETTDDLSVTARVYGLEFKNVFPPNGKAWSQDMIDENVDYPGELRARMDFRQLAPLFNLLYHDGMPPTAQMICDQLPETAACEDCGDGSVTCLTARAIYLHAEDSPGKTVTPVTVDSRDPSCK